MRPACGEAVGRLDGVGSGITPCWVRLTISTSRTCAAMSPPRKPRSMMPSPPSSAWTTAIAARVMVSMLAETIGCFSVMCSEKRAERSIDFGSRRSSTLNRGENRKSSKVQPRTAARSSRHAVIIARLISCTPFENAPPSVRRPELRSCSRWCLVRLKPDTTCLLAQSGPITVLSREGRRTLPAVEVQGHQMVGLDDLANLFQLQVREDAAARAITATYKNQTIVLTPDQSLVSSSGRLVSLPAPLTAPQQPLAGARGVHQPRAGAHLRRPARLSPGIAPARRRRPARAARDGAVRRQPGVAARHASRSRRERRRRSRRSRDRLLVRIDADALDASLPPAAAATVADRHSRDRSHDDSAGSRSALQHRSARRRRFRAAPPPSSRSSSLAAAADTIVRIHLRSWRSCGGHPAHLSHPTHPAHLPHR